MIPIDFPEDDVTSVTSNISGVVGVLGAEAIGLSKWLVFFGCLLEELSIHSVILTMTALNSSNRHPKKMSHLLSPIASAPSAPTTPEIFDVTDVTSSSGKSLGII